MRTALATFFVISLSAATGAFAADREAKAIDRIDASAVWTTIL